MTQGNDPTVSFLFETVRYVNHLPGVNPVHALVGVRAGQWSPTLNVRAHFHIIQGISPEAIRKFLATGIPRCLEPHGMYMVGKPHYLTWLAVASHETYTSHITPIAVQQTVQKIVIQ